MTVRQQQRARRRRVALLAVQERDYSEWTEAQLDRIAMLVAQMRETPLTMAQRERLRIIAAELLRRADQ